MHCRVGTTVIPEFLWLDVYDSGGIHFSGYARLTPGLGFISGEVMGDFRAREIVVNKESGPMGCWLSVDIELQDGGRLVLDAADVIGAATSERQEERGDYEN